MIVRTFGLALCALVAALAFGGPADAQFTSTYPVIIVPPPPAQNIVNPRKPVPKAAAPATPAAPPPDTNPTEPLQCFYQGQTRVCR